MDIQDLYERVYDGHEGRLLRPTAFIAQADFSLLYVLCLENGWVSEKAEGTVLLIFAGVYAWVSWRLMRMGYVSDRFGFRSYPMTLLEISGLLMMVLRWLPVRGSMSRPFCANCLP